MGGAEGSHPAQEEGKGQWLGSSPPVSCGVGRYHLVSSAVLVGFSICSSLCSACCFAPVSTCHVVLLRSPLVMLFCSGLHLSCCFAPVSTCHVVLLRSPLVMLFCSGLHLSCCSDPVSTCHVVVFVLSLLSG